MRCVLFDLGNTLIDGANRPIAVQLSFWKPSAPCEMPMANRFS